MNKLIGLTLATLSFSALAKLPDPLWTPQGGNYQQQFGGPVSHEKSVHHTGNVGAQKAAHVNPPSGNSAFPPAHHLL